MNDLGEKSLSVLEHPDHLSDDRVVVVSIEDLIKSEFPPRETILSPWLRKQSLDMIHAWRGIGKTHVALEIAYAVATGGQFLKWGAPKPRGVLYVDGEMPASTLQERLSRIIASEEREPDPNLFRIITPDLQKTCVPDLATEEGQKLIEAAITDETDLIILDNLSCLVRRGGRENDAESWLSVQEWALHLRSRGKSILFIHHSGKSGAQRGTSKREDVLDTVLSLRRPPGYEGQEGCSIQIHFEKARGLAGPDVEPIEAKLSTHHDGTRKWEYQATEDALPTTIQELVDLGMDRREIIRELRESYGKSQATAYRLTEPFFKKVSQ
ncbi:AAA family ATPase [Leptospirillum ferriphilum]|nr:AAA family ATPase [Leptospirillum ferriphilum]